MGTEVNGKENCPPPEKSEAALYAERTDTFNLASQVAQLQSRAFLELQNIVQQEQKARRELDAKVESNHQVMLGHVDKAKDELLDNITQLRNEVREMQLQQAEMLAAQKQLQVDLAEERENRLISSRNLKEEMLSMKFELVRMINQESESREILKDTVTSHHAGLLTKHSNQLDQARTDTAALRAWTEAKLEDTRDECKVSTEGTYTKLKHQLDAVQADFTKRQQDIEERSGALERQSEFLTSGHEHTESWQAEYSQRLEQEAIQALRDLTLDQGRVQNAWDSRTGEMQHQLDLHQKYIREELKQDLEGLREGARLADKAITNEQNSVSSLICRMQGAETQLAAIENTQKAQELEREELIVIMRRAETQVRDFNSLVTRVDGMSSQVNRQGILVQNVQEKLGSQSQILSSLGRQ